MKLYLKAQMPKLGNWLQGISSGAFLRHVWRQKAVKLYTRNHLHNFGIWAFICLISNVLFTFEGWNAEVGPLIADIWSLAAWRQKTMPAMISNN